MTPVATLAVIADTHGLLRPEAVAALRGADAIVHAGDIGSPDIVPALAEIAPVTAVRGNNDRGVWAESLPDDAIVEIAGVRVYVRHDVKTLDLDPRARGFAAVLAGHSHQPRAEERDGVLFFNPGSAGPRRFRLPVTVGRLTISDRRIRPAIIPLLGPGAGVAKPS